MSNIRYNLKMLVSQDNYQVIWLTSKPEPYNYIPKFDCGFDYITFNGTSSIDLIKEYKYGRLAYNEGNFEIADFSPYKDQTFPLRAKCLSLRYVDSRIKTISENFLGIERPYLAFKFHVDLDRKDTHMSKVLSEIHGITLEEASNFIKFKAAEYENVLTEFELVRYEHTENLKKAQTLEQVFDQHKIVSTRLLYHPGAADRHIATMKSYLLDE